MCFLANLNESIKQKSAEWFQCFIYVRHLIKNKEKSVERKRKSQKQIHHLSKEGGSTQKKGIAVSL